jgi:hypothetical protein
MWVRGVGLAGSVVVLLTAISTPVASATTIGSSAADRAITVLADPARSATDLRLPADFRAVMGYAAAQERGPDGLPVAVRSDATCSSPFGATHYDFGQACRVHDLGYDVLRYAAITGEPVGSWARRALDAAFGERMREHCAAEFTGLDRVSCVVLAGAYQGSVSANSWRQGYGAPMAEPAWAVVVPAGFGGLCLGLFLLRRLRRRRLPSAGRTH